MNPTLAAGLGDALSFAAIVTVLIVAPAAGVLASGVAMQKRGLNRWCAFGTMLFFIALMIEGMIWGLARKGSINPGIELWGLLGTGGLHTLSGLMAIHGLGQCLRHRRWPRGRKRAILVICFNFTLLIVLTLYFYVKVNQSFYERLYT